MWGFERFSTILLAATSATNKYSPKSVQDISGDFRELYSILGEKAPVYQQATPTIRFNFVTPPPKDKRWRDEDVMYSDSELMADDMETLFVNVAAQHGEDKPIVLYLPGLDGFGISADLQFDDLSRTFELWRMSVKIEDTTSFGDLSRTVCHFIEQVSTSTGTNRPVYVVAESFGGLLAPAVALQLEKKHQRKGTENPLKGLTLVNPATSFDESSWDVLAPVLSALGFLTENTPMPFGLPSPYSIIGSLTLSNLIPSNDQFQKILDTMLNLDSLRQISASGAIDSIQGTLDSFRLTGESLPPSLLEHRIKNWMIVGSSLVIPRLSQLETPTLVVVGTDDKLIPSGSEVQRLTKTLPNCEKLEVKGSGHFVLDDKVNLTEAIIYSKMLDPLNFKETLKPYDPILDWKLPSKEVIDQVRKDTIDRLEEAFSPIYISTDTEGNRAFGLDNLPRDCPLLFVSNHQLCK
jgi:pimeloyl-ACP methyl ester carboxylesterase